MHSENGRVGRLRREKCQKNGNPEKMRVRMSSTERIEAIAIQCIFVTPIPREKNLQSVIVFSNVF